MTKGTRQEVAPVIQWRIISGLSSAQMHVPGVSVRGTPWSCRHLVKLGSNESLQVLGAVAQKFNEKKATWKTESNVQNKRVKERRACPTKTSISCLEIIRQRVRHTAHKDIRFPPLFKDCRPREKGKNDDKMIPTTFAQARSEKFCAIHCLVRFFCQNLPLRGQW